jgi:choloylglycine hydrolase
MCTRVFWSDNAVAAVAGRTLDLSFLDSPSFGWRPAGLTERGFDEEVPLTWTSRYASLAIVEWEDDYLDGMNDQGLAAHALMFTTAEYEPPDARPRLSTSRWVQYLLDNFATVADAVRGLAEVRVAPVSIMDVELGVHIAIEDASGDSAIIEPVDGKMIVHHGRDHRVMANSPKYTDQVGNRERYRPFGGELPPPGDITSLDRFVRASYFLHFLPEPRDCEEAVSSVMQVVSTVAKPPGAPYPEGDVYPTRWFSAVDLTNLEYYFWSRVRPSLIRVNLANLAQLQVPSSLDAFDPTLAGEVSAAMRPTPARV